MTYFINNTEIGVVLTAGTQNPAVVNPGVGVTNITTAHAGDAIYGSATYAWTLTNYGQVVANSTTSFAGVDLRGGGTVTNAGTGQITGYGVGVYITGGQGTVNNYSTIQGTGTASTGIDLKLGGVISNTGMISAGLNAVYAGGSATVNNTGTITGTGTTFTGIDLVSGGSVNNSSGGVISGGLNAVFVQNGSIANAGTIADDQQIAVWLRFGGTFSNASGGLVTGYSNGVYADGSATVINAGTITANGTSASAGGVELAAGGTINNTGSIGAAGSAAAVKLGVGGTLTNQLGAVVSAYYNAVIGQGTIINYGMITVGGTLGHAIDLTGTGVIVNYGTITNNSLGNVNRIQNATVAVHNSAGIVRNFGTIANTGIYDAVRLNNGGIAANYRMIAGGLNGVEILAASGTVNNIGTITGSDLGGTSGSGVSLAAGGSIVNGNVDLSMPLIEGYDGVRVSGPGGTLVNLATIASTGTGFGAQGVDFLSGGTLTNYHTITGTNTEASGINAGFAPDRIVNGNAGNTGALIEGWLNGIDQFSSAGTVVNFGTVLSTNGDGIYLQAGGTVTNTGTASLISGANNGVRITGAPGTVNNYGRINGLNYAGVQITGGTVRNHGTIGALGTAHAAVAVRNAAGTVINYGLLQAPTAGAGIHLHAGGFVDNAVGAQIVGCAGGVDVTGAAGSVVNSGKIFSTASLSGAGVYLGGGGTVNNNIGGFISAYGNAISVKGGAGTIVNYGSISSSGTYFSGVYLGAGGVVTNGTSGNIDSVWVGVDLKNVAGTVVNLGKIVSTDTLLSPLGFHAVGVLLQQGGLVVNGSGAVTNALITGYERGIYIGGGKGISNPGAIGTLINYGTVTSTGTGVNARAAAQLTSGGTINNYGTILSDGSNAIQISGTVGATVSNSGRIQNYSAHAAIYSRAGGVITNAAGTATITSPDTAISFRDTAGTTVSFGTVINAGSIISTATGATGVGVYFGQGGTLNNQSGGLIQAYRTGISAVGSPAAITNQGVIRSTGDGFSGIYLHAAGNVANSATGGLIQGTYAGIHVTGGAGTVSNLGTIDGIGTGIAAGIVMRAGGSVSNGSNTVPTAQIVGNQKWGVFVDGGIGTVSNFGTIRSLGAKYVGVYLKGGGNVTNYGGGSIIGAPGIDGVAIGDAGGTVTNAASIDGIFFHNGGSVGNSGLIDAPNQGIEFFGGFGGAGTVSNAGTITESGGGAATTGVVLSAGGLVSNLSGGVISGGYYGIAVRGGSGTVINGGVLANTARYRAAVYMTVDGAVTNHSGGVIDGGVAIAGAGSVSNFGSISVLRNSTNIGIGFGAGGIVNNGQSGLPNAVIAGERFGIEIYGGVGSVTNFGAITATVGTGVKFGVAGSTLTDAGIITGAGGTAVTFTGGGNSLVALQGAMFTGAIYGGGGGNDVLELGAAGASVGVIGYAAAPIFGFDRLVVDAGANWQLLGSETFAAGGTVGGGATLAVGGNLVLGASFGDNGTVEIGAGAALSGIQVSGGGILEVAAGGTVSAAQVAAGGREIVDSGGTDFGAIVTSGGFEDIFGTASGTQVLGGGNQTVEAGGRTVAVTLDGSASQLVSGVASATTVSAGDTLTVANGGTAVGAVVLVGGREIVTSGGSDVAATLSGGEQDIFGTASGTVVDSGGVQLVDSGGVASGTTISAGGSAGIAGGRLAIASGGAVSGTIGFVGSGGTLEIGSNVMPTVPIGGVASSDAFDLRAMPYAAGDTVSFASGTLTVTSGTLNDALKLSGAAPGLAFHLSSDLQGGTLVTAVPAAQVNLFDFVFTYTDGADYYVGTVADDGRYGYQVNEQVPAAKGQYLIYNEEGLPAAAASGTVVVLAYSHGGPGAASAVPVLTAAGTPDGGNGLTSESDFVLGVDGGRHPFSSSQEATFNTVALYGFVFRYTDGRAFYTGTVAGSPALPVSADGSYMVFAEGVTTEAAGTVVVDRFNEDGASYIPTGNAGGSGGLGSEAGVLTVAGGTFSFDPTTEPILPSTITTVVAAPAPSATDLITAEVDQVYNDILGRNPDPGGLATFSADLAAGVALATVRQDLAASPEAQSDLNGLYQQVLGRTIDPSGDASFTAYLADGGSLASAQQLLALSPEAQTDIETIYQEVLNRPADPSGLASFTAALADQVNPLSLGQERNIIAHSGEAQNDLISLFQATISPSRAPSAAELTGMEDQLANPGVTQQSLQSALAGTGSAGGYTTVTPPAGNASLTAQPGVPTLFDFSSVGFGQDTIAGFDPTRDTVKLPVALVNNFTTLQQQDLSASAAGALITLGGQSITLSGVSPPSLGSTNFLFG